MDTFTLSATSRQYPNLPYEAIKNDILGKTYQLSLVFVGATRAKVLNETHRGKTYVPNVLSFPLDATTGEIVIAPSVAKKEAARFGKTYEGYVGFLFIHGCLHLKGLDHGATMDKAEVKYCTKYHLT